MRSTAIVYSIVYAIGVSTPRGAKPSARLHNTHAQTIDTRTSPKWP